MDKEELRRKYKAVQEEVLNIKTRSTDEKLLRNINKIKNIEKMVTSSALTRKKYGINVNVRSPLDMHLKWSDCNFSYTVLSKIPFSNMRPVQMQVIPYILAQKSVCAISETGSGKTLSFVLPYTQLLYKSCMLLVLVPTKELAKQVHEEFQKYMEHAVLVTSNSVFEEQIRCLQTAQVVVATIGRIVEHLSFRTFDLTKINYLVVDEMDKILGDGFEKEFEFIWESISPKAIQLFSATNSPKISKFGISTMITVGKANRINPRVALEFLEAESKPEMLNVFLGQYRPKTTTMIIFCNQINTCEFLESKFSSLAVLHGKKTTDYRREIMKKISEGRIRYLVCTDIASRGIDFEDVDLVINYDFPRTIETFIHRAGRTGRSIKGKCVSFLCKEDVIMYNELKLLAAECRFELPSFVREKKTICLN